MTGTLQAEGGTHQGGPCRLPLVAIPDPAPSLTNEGHDSSEDGTGRHALVFQPRYFTRDNKTGNADSCSSDIVPPLRESSAGGDSETMVAYGISNQPTPKVGEEVCPSLDAKASGGGRMECVAVVRTDSTGANGCGVLEDGTTHTLGGATDVVAFQLTGDRDNPSVSTYDEIHPTLPANPMSDRRAAVAFGLQTANSNMRGPIYKKEQAWTVQPHPSQTRTAVAWHNHQQDGSIRIQDDGTCPTVSKHWGTGGNNVPMVGVRRLTPTECERLQGFPDGWTDVDGASDSARYRQLGNAVAVPCAEWLARRIVAVEEAT